VAAEFAAKVAAVAPHRSPVESVALVADESTSAALGGCRDEDAEMRQQQQSSWNMEVCKSGTCTLCSSLGDRS